MRSARERTVWTVLAVALVAAAGAAWWTADQWLPQAEPWTENAWSRLTRPGADSLPPEKKSAQGSASGSRGAASAPVEPRKCLQNGRTTYTDQKCPRGSQEQALDGAVTSLPRAP